MNIIRESAPYAVVEIDERYYVVEIDWANGEVYSALASDAPDDGGRWYGRMTDKGVQYVATGRSRSAAIAGMRRLRTQQRV